MKLVAWGETTKGSKYYKEPSCSQCNKKVKIKETSYTLRREGIPDYGLVLLCEECYKNNRKCGD